MPARRRFVPKSNLVVELVAVDVLPVGLRLFVPALARHRQEEPGRSRRPQRTHTARVASPKDPLSGPLSLSPNPYGDFAVGESVASWMRPHEWDVAALLFAALGSSVVLAVVTAIQRRRSQPG